MPDELTDENTPKPVRRQPPAKKPRPRRKATEALTEEAASDTSIEWPFGPQPEPTSDTEPETADVTAVEEEPAAEVADKPVTLNKADADEPAPVEDPHLRETANRAWPNLGATPTGDVAEPPAAEPPAPEATAPGGAPERTLTEEWPAPTIDAPLPAKACRYGRDGSSLAVPLAFLTVGIVAGGLLFAPLALSSPAVPQSSQVVVQTQDSLLGAIQQAQQATVTIAVDGPDGVSSRGAGTVFNTGGYILTTNLVVPSGSNTIRVTDARGIVHNGQFIGTDQATGLTVIRAQNSDLPAVNLTERSVIDGQRVAIIGQNNNATSTTVASDRQAVDTVTGTGGTGTWTSALRLSGDNDSTAAGGPVVNPAGQVVGIATSGVTTDRDSDPTGRQYAITAAVAGHVAHDIANQGVTLHGMLGATVTDQITGIEGATVEKVTASSPADNAGLRSGDVVTQFNGTRVGNAAQLIAAVRATTPGDTYPITILRNGDPLTTEVTPVADQ